uniref:minibinder 7.7 n=1 Tax=Homo sapiens TaxID=9606 RepID=UPI0039BD93E3
SAMEYYVKELLRTAEYAREAGDPEYVRKALEKAELVARILHNEELKEEIREVEEEL